MSVTHSCQNVYNIIQQPLTNPIHEYNSAVYISSFYISYYGFSIILLIIYLTKYHPNTQ